MDEETQQSIIDEIAALYDVPEFDSECETFTLDLARRWGLSRSAAENRCNLLEAQGKLTSRMVHHGGRQKRAWRMV